MVSRCDIADPTGRSSRDQEVKAEVYAPCPQVREKRRSGQCQESSQSEDYGLSRQEEVPSTSHDQEDTKSSLPNALQVKKNELVEFLLTAEYLQLVFGLEVKEVDPSEHTYILVPTLGLTLNEMLRDGQGLPKPSFLVVILCLIAVEDDRAPEEIWRTLRRMEVCPRREHYIFGEPRELLTQVWVREGYLEYQQVPDGDPGCYEFLWGP
ncbi:PREDICTED: melanoma-associated antigen 9-like [Capra hircus]|uniref:melanoma-associated antigen 9-like n=1 Tax=Capra hircus TaxID=9925 RepID=UPI000846DF4C|nr:PREDICTED: melanoma-associated antigen 9-like [Capra hircus]